MKPYLPAIALLLSVGFLTGCTEKTSISSPLTNTVVTTPQQVVANRVVALTPLTSDIIYQLDLTKLVGVSGSKLISEDQRFKGLPGVTGDRTPPNLEQIVALKPDLVIGASGFHDEALAKLKELGIQTIATDINGLSSLEDLTRTLAEVTNTNPEPLLKRYQSWVENPPSRNPSTLVLVSQQPILAPNKTSWAGDVLAKFTSKNLAAELQGQSPMQGYVTLSPEKVLAANPEVVIVIDRDGSMLDQFKAQPFWRDLNAVKSDRVYVLDYYGLINPGSLDKIEAAMTRLKQVL
jgi:iron complex transport system substrate-binding protein